MNSASYGVGGKMSKLRNTEFLAVACLLLISVIAEVFIFNFRYFVELASGAPRTEISVYGLTDETDCNIGTSGLTVENNSVFRIKNPGVAVNSIRINTTGGIPFTLSVNYTDEASSNKEISAGDWVIDPDVTGSGNIRLISSGKCGYIKFTVSNTVGTSAITSIELNYPYFQFRFTRFALLFFILLIIRRLRRPGLWNSRIDFENSNRGEALFIIYFAAAFLSIVLCTGYGGIQTFSASVGSDGDCYQLLTEAFSNGRLSFLQEPPQALKTLSNPYDPSARTFSYIFDSAYFGGHYYCYFGITPVITLLLPFKLLTGLYMPTTVACLIYMLVLLFAVLFLYKNIVAKWFPKISYMQYVGGAIAVTFGANLFWLAARTMFYELAVISALAYLFLGFSLLIRAASGARRPVLTLCFSGLCFALTVAARPTYIFYLAAALPLLIPLIFYNAGRKRLHFKRAAAFFVPLAVFAAVLMAYNYARFGSPFNFGQRYQLTISDVRFNKVTNLAAIPGGVYHYFFAPLGIDLTYPFFHVVLTAPDTSSGYYYNQPMAGIFNFPVLLILFASAYILKRMPRKRRELKIFTAILLVSALVITYLDITLAGVLERYTLDIGPALVFVSVILWFEVLEYFRLKGAAGPVTKLFFTVCLVTAIISTLCCSVGEYDIQMQSNPQVYENLALMFEFWR